jgi:anthranilate synthase component 1
MSFRAEALTRHLSFAPDPKALFAALEGAVLFETGDASSASERRSILVTDVAVRLEVRGLRVRALAVSVHGRAVLASMARALAPFVVDGGPALLDLAFPRGAAGDDAARLVLPSPLDAIRALVDADVHGDRTAHAVFAAVRFGYDLCEVFEPLPPPRTPGHGLPDAVALLAEGAIVIDGAAATTRIYAAAFGDAPTALPDAAARLAQATAVISTLGDDAFTPRAAPSVRATVDHGDAEFAALVTTLREHVYAGDVFQIVASRTFSAPCSDPLSAYARLASQNPSPYQFVWSEPGALVFGASPEAAVRVTRADGERRLHLHPIAGTRRRGATADEDDRIEAELRLSTKEVSEHMMLVDLARNDVARVCVAGTRRVARLLATERYSQVMHLVSEVTGTLRPEIDALRAYAACANMGTLVGAPKLRAAELLREHEPSKREVYGGAIGWLSHDGTFDSAIVIRSALVKDGNAHVRAGAGIVADSDPAAEADETSRKARAVLRALGATEVAS